MKQPIRVLVVGCGNMGASHAKAYEQINGFRICGLVSRGDSKVQLNKELKHDYPLFSDFQHALNTTRPDAVCISTYPETHETYAIQAFKQGCHVFLEKPIATTVTGAERVAEAAKRYNRKLVVGYILRYHPSWRQFIKSARTLGAPLVMRMNLNQQSQGYMWNVHKNLMQSLSPIVDCGVHYIDVMCQMTQSPPIRVSAIGARLTDEIPRDNYNYGQLQLWFQDGSVGWYEAGWGPMISETAFFIKDVVGPKGAVSILARNAGSEGKSDSVEAHTQTEAIRIHHSALDADNRFIKNDEWINLQDEPDHLELCVREQQFFLDAIREDMNLDQAIGDAVNSLKIALACDESVKTGAPVDL